MILTLYDSYGNVKARIEPDGSSTQEKEIQGDNLLNLSFTLYEFIPIDVNDYIDYEGERWKSHTNLTHPGKYFRPSKVKIMRPTSPK